MTPPCWLKWAREIQAIAQTASFYAHDDYDQSRARQLMNLAAEMVSESAEMPAETVFEGFTAQRGYSTPKVDVRAAVFENDGLLLVQEKADSGWTFPGGWADVGETPREAVERETREESGYVVEARRLIGVYDANRIRDELPLFHAYKLLFLCEKVGGEACVSSETSAVRFFNVDDIPEKLSANRTLPRQIQDAIEVYRNPHKKAVFD